jgi:hypothetical protein
MLSIRYRVIAVLLALPFWAACGSSTNAGGGSGGSTPSEAPDKLPHVNAQTFEAWKTQLIKTCDANVAFTPGSVAPTNATVGVDFGALLARTHNSLILRGDQGEFAVLAAMQTFNDTNLSIANINGVHIEMNRVGSRCTVTANGQQIHETVVAQSFMVKAFWSPQRKIADLSAHTVFQDDLEGGLASLTEHGFAGLLMNSLAIDDQAFQFLGQYFGLSSAVTQQMFLPPSSSEQADVEEQGGRLNLPGALWFNGDSPRIIAVSDSLRGVFQKAPATVGVEWRIKPPSLQFDNFKNDGDAGSLSLHTIVSIQVDSSAADTYSYSLRALQIDNKVTPFDPIEAAACMRERTLLFHKADTSIPVMTVNPEIKEAIAPCEQLSANAYQQFLNDGTFKALLPVVVAEVVPIRGIDYQAWDDVLEQLSISSLLGNQDPAHDLDPTGQARLIKDAGAYLVKIKAARDQGRNYNSISERDLYRMGLAWAMTGQAVAADRIAYIVSAADHSVAPFAHSTHDMLMWLGINSTGGDAALKFAASINETFAAQALGVLQQSRALSLKEWERLYYNQVLQKQISQAQMLDWGRLFTGTHNLFTKYPTLGPAQFRLAKVVMQLQERGAVDLGQLDNAFHALSNTLPLLPVSTQILINDMGDHGLPASQEAIDYALAMTPEMKNLAQLISDQSLALGLTDLSAVTTNTVLQRRPTWAQLNATQTTLTAASAFTDREQNRTRGKGDFAANEKSRKDLIAKALRENWGNTEFAAIEQMSVLGSYRASCQQFNGASDVVTCLGLDNFSTHSAGVLEPQRLSLYGQLAKAMVGYMNQLQARQFVDVRTLLVDTFFTAGHPIWSSCSIIDFSAKTSSLKQTVTILAATTSPAQQKQVETELGLVLADCHN